MANPSITGLDIMLGTGAEIHGAAVTPTTMMICTTLTLLALVLLAAGFHAATRARSEQPAE